jgi:phage protein U
MMHDRRNQQAEALPGAIELGDSLSSSLSGQASLDLAAIGPREIALALHDANRTVTAYQIVAARRVQELSDRLLQAGAKTDDMASPNAPLLQSRERFEQLLAGLRELSSEALTYTAGITKLASAAGSSARSEMGLKIGPGDDAVMLADSLETGLVDTLNHRQVLQRRLMQDLYPLRLAISRLDGNSSVTLEYRSVLNTQLCFLDRLARLSSQVALEHDVLDTRLVLSPTGAREPAEKLSTTFTRGGSVSLDTLERLAELCKAVVREPGDRAIHDRGVIITPQTKEVLKRHLEQGASLITLEQHGIAQGFALYYEPGSLPSHLGATLSQYRDFGSAAFVHLILVSPTTSGTPAHQMLLNAVLVQLQRTRADVAVGRVESTNDIARRAHFTNGWREMPTDVVHVASPRGATAHFTGHYLPVSPELRRTLRAPEIRASLTDWPTLSSDAHVRIMSPERSSAAQAKDLKSGAITIPEMVEALSASRHAAVVRFTGGCADMHRRDWLGAIQLFTEAFDGYEGSLLAGATRSLVKTDDGLSKNHRPSICELPLAIHVSNPDSVVGGICIGEETAASFEEHIIVSGSTTSSEPHATVKHPDYNLYVTANETEFAHTERWDAEWKKALQIIGDLQERGIRPCLVSFNGGRATTKEIHAWASQGLPVILIRGSGRETDRIAADADFLAAHPSVLVVNRAATELRQALQEVGALPEPTEVHLRA